MDGGMDPPQGNGQFRVHCGLVLTLLWPFVTLFKDHMHITHVNKYVFQFPIIDG